MTAPDTSPVVATDTRISNPPKFLDRVLRPLATRALPGDLVLASLTVVIGATLRFTQDDAFITLRYSRHLADGDGLVFNLGERVEGYTNFLWTAWLALPHALEVDPVLWSDASSIAAGIVTVLVTRRLAARLIDDEVWALLGAGLLVGFHSFAIYLTGGLETQWQTCFVTLVVWLLLKGTDPAPRPAFVAAASFFAGLACLTRLDSAVLLAVAGVPIALRLRRDGLLQPRLIVVALAPAAVVLVPWFVWKLSYYDALLPNTFVAKQTPILWAIARGAFFVALFLAVTLLFVALPLARAGWSAWRRSGPARWLSGIVIAWFVYLLYVGGDFMEFRFLVPVLPVGFVLLTSALARLEPDRALAVIAVIVMGSLIKWALFYPAVLGIESARALEDHVTDPAGWREIGEVLAADFPEGEQGGPTIAVTAAGAVPYYAGLRTIDMLGLTDVDANDESNRWELTKLKAGHEHIATVDYLSTRGVDLVLGGLQTSVCGTLTSRDAIETVREMFLTYEVQAGDLPSRARLVEIPLRSNERCVAALLISRRDFPGYRAIDIPGVR